MLSLLLLYVGQSLGAAADQDAATKQLRMLLLAVGVILLDYASQAAINPCEALVSDLMAGQPGEAGGFTVRTLYIILFIYFQMLFCTVTEQCANEILCFYLKQFPKSTFKLFHIHC